MEKTHSTATPLHKVGDNQVNNINNTQFMSEIPHKPCI